ncbi:hypothetical protein, partial [Escherichia coli]
LFIFFLVSRSPHTRNVRGRRQRQIGIRTRFMIQLWPFYGGNTDFEQLGMAIQIYIIKLLLNKRFNDFKNSFYDNRKF